MPNLYRVMKRLSTGHIPGQLVRGNRFKHLDILVDCGALAAVTGPPLAELPGWVTRSEKLAPLGIITADDFLEYDPKKLTKQSGYKEKTIERWRTEIEEIWLLAVDEVPLKKD